MSIDAVITRVERHADGTATIFLAERPGGGHPGQFRLRVENPPLSFEACVGTEVTGNAYYLYVGSVVWAERIGYAGLRLLAMRKG